jgi:hypothetical protein
LRKERKEGNSWAEGIAKEDESRDHSSKERRVCNSLVLRRTEQQDFSRCKKLLAVFSVQDDKWGCRKMSD